MSSSKFNFAARRFAALLGAAMSVSLAGNFAHAQALNGPGTQLLNSGYRGDLGMRRPTPPFAVDVQTEYATPMESSPQRVQNPIYDRERYPELWSRGRAPAVEEVRIAGNYAPGSIIIDHMRQYLYVTRSNGTAVQFPIVVGRAGSEISGSHHTVMAMEMDPTWQAPAGDRRPNPFATPGPHNPLGVRGIYLQTPEGVNQGYLIHGTNRPEVFNLPDGKRKASAGCIRMLNADVEIAYEMVREGAPVIIYYNNELASRITRTGNAQPNARPN